MINNKAFLVFEDGTFFEGKSFGAKNEAYGEIVFNTALTGYQEILTDPSYYGQMVVMTYPHIGNYGINTEDFESQKIYLSSFIAKEFSKGYSNYRAVSSLENFLIKHNITGIEDVDTRKIVRHIRNYGSMNALITTSEDSIMELTKRALKYPHIQGIDLVKDVTTKNIYEWNKALEKDFDGIYDTVVVVVDFGVKYNILRYFVQNNCRVIVVPAFIDIESIRKLNPDGIFFSNGPGDPEPVKYGIELAKNIIGKYPVAGICLGCQILSLALSGKTYKLKFGHHGGNHPVKDLRTSKIYITTQNHCFAVDIDSLKSNIDVTHINLNDQTVEGIMHRDFPLYAVQFHPENGPGPGDASYIFSDFINLLKLNKR